MIHKILSLLLINLFCWKTLAAQGIPHPNTIRLSDHKGRTYFSLMEKIIKPALDEAAREGFYLTSGKKAVAHLKSVDAKVSRKALRAAGNSARLKLVTDRISIKREKLTFYELPQKLAEEGILAGRYDLTTYLALASSAGVAVEINDRNHTYHVNYGTGEKPDDEKTGRSFAESPGRKALDASDKHYLQILENYLRTERENSKHFYLTLLHILLNSDSSGFNQISINGQAVAADFLAVYTAEQNRHLMSDLKRHPWDEALLEITLLSALHSGQKQIKLIFEGRYTSTTNKQKPGCDLSEKIPKRASLIDYWQFSKSTDPAHCNRSGLNINKRDFRTLGRLITLYHKRHQPELYKKVAAHFNPRINPANFFAQLSNFLVNYDTPERLNSKTLKLAEDFTQLLMQTAKDADRIDLFIEENLKQDLRIDSSR